MAFQNVIFPVVLPPGADNADAHVGQLAEWLPGLGLGRALTLVGRNRSVELPPEFRQDDTPDYSDDRDGYRTRLRGILRAMDWRVPIVIGGALIRRDDFHELTVYATGWHLDPVRWVDASPNQVLQHLGVSEQPEGFAGAWGIYADEIVPQMTRLIRGGLAVRIPWRDDQEGLQQAIRQTIRDS